jgi:ribonuclease HII
MRQSNDVKPIPDLTYEIALAHNGCKRIAGLDEAGRGAWAGPVVAAAVVLPLENTELPRLLEGVRDSKQMTSAQREQWATRIYEVAVVVGLGESSPQEVDELGLIPATRNAMARALSTLGKPADYLLIDHLHLPEIPLPQMVLTRGDARALSIAAASVIAKVTRDQTMHDLDDVHPGYGFARHKGYGTAVHQAALQRLGPCDIHRRSYAPVAAYFSSFS